MIRMETSGLDGDFMELTPTSHGTEAMSCVASALCRPHWLIMAFNDGGSDSLTPGSSAMGMLVQGSWMQGALGSPDDGVAS
eukprot:CAMPEP_0197944128 /NCGR_PEP_ID=MMETSP1439-20131203/125256_1 /TAXON_ID=66791 /ORGANISM="Gonyaulax spinifera, Strain CCMP409" /LENGTH=80 /DNA_ID=CAMNT_0043567383 /DNA_START=250 /DNA_END=493 /DNA_ORIENTATION=-